MSFFCPIPCDLYPPSALGRVLWFAFGRVLAAWIVMAAAIWPRSSGCSVGCYSDISEVGLAGKVRGQMKRRGVAFRDINPARLKTEELSSAESRGLGVKTMIK